MDAFEDTIAAFDRLIEWLGRHPHHDPGRAWGQDVLVLRHPGEYSEELGKRCARLILVFNHLLEDGLPVPADYTWRRFREVMESGCSFRISEGFYFDAEGQAEARRVVAAARGSLLRIRDGRAGNPPDQPFLPFTEYETILALIRSWAEAVERNPKALGQLDEESLRSQCLAMLNAQYEGQGTAETFNKWGKTDIFLRVKTGAVYIAECKIWSGPKAFSNAVDQLLGYLTWRDTKASILIFNASLNLTKVLDAIERAAASHPQFRFAHPHPFETELRFTLQHPDDVDREVLVTVQVIDIPPKGGKGKQAQ